MLSSLKKKTAKGFHVILWITIIPKSPLIRSFKRFSGQKALTKYIGRRDCYIEPQEISLGFDLVTEKRETSKNLATTLKHEDALGSVLYNQASFAGRGHYKNFLDWQAYSQNLLLSSEGTTLQLVLYHDDFNIDNPLGDKKKTTKYKVSAFYFVLGKFPTMFSS